MFQTYMGKNITLYDDIDLKYSGVQEPTEKLMGFVTLIYKHCQIINRQESTSEASISKKKG